MSDAWIALRRFTQARIALGRAGHAVPTSVQVEFQLAHARARDAVHVSWDVARFADRLRELGEEALLLETRVANRDEYLRRPDLGRLLSDQSRTLLAGVDRPGADVALVVSNGLSSTAVERHGMALVQTVLDACRARQLSIAPVCLATNGRVALADDIGSLLAARTAVIIIGERPGLSAADSLGIYLTYGPRPGTTDAQRNCISNIRPPEGLSCEEAATKLLYLIGEALRRGISGVSLKDDAARLLSD